MSERLYCLRPDPAVFDAGTARGKQVLLSNDVNEISLYWFAPDGTFLELELIPIEPATLPPGSRKWSDGKVVAEGLNWNQRVERQLADLKDKLGFVQGEIHVRKFESDAGAILDLPGEYVEFLDNAEEYSTEDRERFEGYIQEWRQAKDFVLDLGIEYWMNEAGEVTSS
jgi:hypothetical protein